MNKSLQGGYKNSITTYRFSRQLSGAIRLNLENRSRVLQKAYSHNWKSSSHRLYLRAEDSIAILHSLDRLPQNRKLLSSRSLWHVVNHSSAYLVVQMSRYQVYRGSQRSGPSLRNRLRPLLHLLTAAGQVRRASDNYAWSCPVKSGAECEGARQAAVSTRRALRIRFLFCCSRSINCI